MLVAAYFSQFEGVRFVAETSVLVHTLSVNDVKLTSLWTVILVSSHF